MGLSKDTSWAAILRKSVFLLIFLILMPRAFAGSPSIDAGGFGFDVQSVSIGDWEGKRYLVIFFRFTNKTPSRKVDLDRAFQYTLSDNLGNHYRQLPVPKDYTKPLDELSPNFPSVYPGDACATTLFFEAPVPKAASLKLDVLADIIGLHTPVGLEFSLGRYADDGDNNAIDIASPGNGDVFAPGDMFPLHVRIRSAAAPHKIIVVAFGRTFEDAAPGLIIRTLLQFPLAVLRGNPGSASLGNGTRLISAGRLPQRTLLFRFILQVVERVLMLC